jgi:hypothetical protein
MRRGHVNLGHVTFAKLVHLLPVTARHDHHVASLDVAEVRLKPWRLPEAHEITASSGWAA